MHAHMRTQTYACTRTHTYIYLFIWVLMVQIFRYTSKLKYSVKLYPGILRCVEHTSRSSQF